MAESFLPPVVATLVADIKQFQAKMAEAKGEMDTFEAKSGAMGRGVAKGLGVAALGVGGLAVGVGVATGAMAMSFQESMTKVQNSASLTQSQTDALGNAFLDTMGKSEFSATELANAYSGVAGKLLVINGNTLSTQQSMDYMNQASELAVARHIDLNTATSALATSMQTFSVPLAQVGDLTNQLYLGSTLSGTSVDSLAGTMQRLHSKAGVALPTMQDMNTFMTDLAQHGVGGGRALTGVVGAVDKLLAPSGKASALLQQMGVHTFGLDGKFVGLRQVIEQLNPAFARMTQEQQLNVSATIFGAQQAEAMTSIIDGGTQAYDKAAKALQNHATVSDAATKASGDLQNQLQTLKATGSDLLIKVGLKIVPQVQQILNAILGKPGQGTAYEITLNVKEFIQTVTGNKPPAPSKGGFFGTLVKGVGQVFKDISGGAMDLLGGAGSLGASLFDVMTGNVQGAGQYMNQAGGAFGAGGRSIWDIITEFGGGSAPQRRNTTGGRIGLDLAGLAPTIQYGTRMDVPGMNANVDPNKLFGDTATSSKQTATNTSKVPDVATATSFTSQHTREANGHLMDIKNNLNKPTKVNVTASFK